MSSQQQSKGGKKAVDVPDKEILVRAKIRQTEAERTANLVKKPCYLLHELPRELRDIIWEFTLTTETYVLEVANQKLVIADPKRDHLSPLLSCHKMYEETFDLPYRLNHFHFGDPTKLTGVGDAFPNLSQRGAIQKIGFTVDTFDTTTMIEPLRRVVALEPKGLPALLSGVKTIYVHSIQTHEEDQDWPTYIKSVARAFSTWDYGHHGDFQKWLKGEDMRSMPRDNQPAQGSSKGKGEEKATEPEIGVKIFFHVVLKDGRHIDWRNFEKQTWKETVRPTSRDVSNTCDFVPR